MKSYLKIPADKWKHIIVGAILGIGFPIGFRYFFAENLLWAFAGSLLAIAIIGYGFEIFSLVTGLGHYDVMDAVATVAGGIGGITISALFIFLI